jgi:predicted dinucleotide-binding enzyme
MTNVVVLIGAGQIGQAIARRVGAGKHVLLADMRLDNANAAATIMEDAGYQVSVSTSMPRREPLCRNLSRKPRDWAR